MGSEHSDDDGHAHGGGVGELVRLTDHEAVEGLALVDHRGAREGNAHLKVMVGQLTQRNKELAESNRELVSEINQRKVLEDSLRASERQSSQLLERSRQLQEELRLLSRRLIFAQEEERKRAERKQQQKQAAIFAALSPQKAAEALAAMPEDQQLLILQNREEKRAAKILEQMPVEKRVRVLTALGEPFAPL